MNEIERLAVIENELKNVNRIYTDHEVRDNDRFDKTFKFMERMKGEIMGAVGDVKSDTEETNKKVGTLWDEKNRREGALSMGRIVAGSVGGAVVMGIQLAIKALK